MPLGFRKVGRLVVCMLLTVVLSNVNGQPVQIGTISSSDTDCPVEHLELQLASMDDRLNRMQEIISSLIRDTERCVDHLTSKLVNLEDRLNRTQTIISSLNSPQIKENCTVDLAACGFDDTTKYSYIRTSGGSSEQIYFGEGIGRYAGVTLVELDAKTCTTRNRQIFDTHSSANDRKELLEAMESASAGTIIVGVTANSPEYADNLKNSVGSFFTRYNMNLTGSLYRAKFAFVMQKGYLRKTLFQRKARYGESLIMRVALRGSTIYDVTFNQV